MSEDDQTPHPEEPKKDQKDQPPRSRNYTGLILVFLICAVCILVFQNTLKEPTKTTFPEFMSLLLQGKVESVEVDRKVLTVTLEEDSNGVQLRQRVIVPEQLIIEKAIMLEQLAGMGNEIESSTIEIERRLIEVLDGKEPGFCVQRRYLIEEEDRSRMLVKMTRPAYASESPGDLEETGASVVYLLEPTEVELADGGKRQLTWTELLKATATDKQNAAHGLPPISDPTVTVTLPLTKGTLGFAEDPGLFETLLISLAPWVLMIFFFWFFIFRQMRGSGMGGNVLSFGRSRARLANREKSNVTFNDVAGIVEAKEEVGEVVEFLKRPDRFTRLGGRIPRGILLVGPPGNGKTLLAKAIAGEADVPFYSISGSDFVEMFVGVGASRVRDLFKQAKENSPCIIFLDEIDAVGRRRGAGLGGGHDEREQTLNAILVEMDGFETDTDIIVLAATNRSDVLDPALLRPGRFDRQISVDLPDVDSREAILAVHARKAKLHPSVDLSNVAKGTPGFSGAELESLINEAAIIAVMEKKEYIFEEDLDEARDRVRWGRAKTSRIMDDKEKRVTAYHEAGHTLMAWLLPEADPPHKVTIIPRGQSLGATMMLPEKDVYQFTQLKAEAQLKVLYGGRVAEEIVFQDITSGAADDIKRASDLARHMVREWGMSDALGPINFTEHEEQVFLGRDLGRGTRYSETTIDTVDREVRRIVESAYEGARHFIVANRDKLDLIAEALLKFEVLSAVELDGLMEGLTVKEVRQRVADANREVESPTTTTSPSEAPAIDDMGPDRAMPPFAGEGAT